MCGATDHLSFSWGIKSHSTVATRTLATYAGSSTTARMLGTPSCLAGVAGCRNHVGPNIQGGIRKCSLMRWHAWFFSACLMHESKRCKIYYSIPCPRILLQDSSSSKDSFFFRNMEVKFAEPLWTCGVWRVSLYRCGIRGLQVYPLAKSFHVSIWVVS